MDKNENLSIELGFAERQKAKESQYKSTFRAVFSGPQGERVLNILMREMGLYRQIRTDTTENMIADATSQNWAKHILWHLGFLEEGDEIVTALYSRAMGGNDE